MRTLRVNKTKLSWGNAFIVDHFALGGKKNQNMTKELTFGASYGVLTCILTLSLRKTHICVFLDYFNLAIFGALPVAFSSLDSKLNKPDFFRLNILVSFCAANQYRTDI